MANTKSSQHDIRKSRERHELNQMRKGLMRGSIRRARTAIQAKEEGVTAIVQAAESLIDRAASRGCIHPNAAARRKSRMAKRLNALKVSA